MRALALAALFTLLLAAPRAQAQDASVSSQLDAVREQVLYASYAEAITGAQALLARTDLTAEQRNTTLELLATAQIANRELDAARTTLTQLYARDPGFRLTDADASPPVVSAFARARESHPTPIAVTLEHTSPGTLPRRESPTIEVHVSAGADAVAEVRLQYRHAGEGAFSRVVLDRRADGVYAGHIPVLGTSDHEDDVGYYVVAVAPSGTEIGRLGTEEAPLEVHIPAEQARVERVVVQADAPAPRGVDVAQEWWFWTILGVVVVGAGVGIGFGVDAATSSPAPGTLGVAVLMH
jgi:hypothetical protein